MGGLAIGAQAEDLVLAARLLVRQLHGKGGHHAEIVVDVVMNELPVRCRKLLRAESGQTTEDGRVSPGRARLVGTKKIKNTNPFFLGNWRG